MPRVWHLSFLRQQSIFNITVWEKIQHDQTGTARIHWPKTAVQEVPIGCCLAKLASSEFSISRRRSRVF